MILKVSDSKNGDRTGWTLEEAVSLEALPIEATILYVAMTPYRLLAVEMYITVEALILEAGTLDYVNPEAVTLDAVTPRSYDPRGCRPPSVKVRPHSELLFKPGD